MLNEPRCHLSSRFNLSPLNPLAHPRQREGEGQVREMPLLSSSTRHDRRIHPGSGRRRGPDHPKGRQVDPTALGEVQALLGERERRRDLLIEHLHLLQDHFGCLHARHLVALAEEMKLSLVEVYEVASFYAHFDIVMEDEAPPPLTVRVCDSLSCELAGAMQLLEGLRGRLGQGVRVVRAPCMGGCHRAPVVAIGHALHEHATVDNVAAAVSLGDSHPAKIGRASCRERV